MKRTYRQLTEAERNLIVVMVNRNKSVHEISRELMRSPSSISREIKRNHGRNMVSCTSCTKMID
ncbi:MAG: helix-turn-helix domain-containing protein [Elusimicrobiota bacterium]